MSIFDRRTPDAPPRLRRYSCEHCEWFSYDPDKTLGHMFATHVNRRVHSVAPNPGRRSGDGHSPWVQQRMAAAANGEGLSRPDRRRLS